MNDKETPLRLLRLWEKMCPGVYASLDRCWEAKKDGTMFWPDFCELPISAAYTYLVSVQEMSEHDAAMVAAELTACWSWQRSKKIFHFDDTLAESLAEQAKDFQDDDVLPADLLLHLPYPCSYIKAPSLFEMLDGFFVWDEYDTNTGTVELRVQWVSCDMSTSFPQMIHLLPGSTLKECIIDTMRVTKENIKIDIDLSEAGVKDVSMILSAIQLVLYIVSVNADIRPLGVQQKQVQPKRPSARVKASDIEEIQVGVRVGAALREAARGLSQNASPGRGGSRRSHTRRGHWHHYWTGPKAGPRKLILKWLSPMVVNPEGRRDADIVVYPVKAGKPSEEQSRGEE